MFEINERIMFQKRPMKFANSTWYCTGTSQKFIVDAKGHIFQFASMVSHSFDLASSSPFRNPLGLLSETTPLKPKNPVSRTGAKRSWSKAMEPMTVTALLAPAKTFAAILGRSLQYQRWRQGAM